MMAYFAYTKSKCPVVLDGQGATHEPTIAYLLKRSFRESKASSTVQAEARHLAVWLNFLEANDKSYFEATSIDIENFREDLENEGSGPENINLYIKTICEAYWFCQQMGMVQDMIGWLDKDKPRQRWLIEVDKAPSTTKSGSPYVIPYKLRVVNQGRKGVPKPKQIEAMARKIDSWNYSHESDLAEALRTRDSLMFRWLSEVGLRRAELVNLWVDDVPKATEDYLPKVTVSRGTKFGKVRNVEISRNLYEETLKYIKYERKQILTSKKSKFGNPSEVQVLFVNGSNNSVRPEMSEEAVYKFIIKLNPENANVGPRIHPHSLRRYALTNYAKLLWKLELAHPSYSPTKQLSIHQNLMHRLAVQAGHTSADTTIKHYVDIGFTQAASKTDDGDLQALKRILQRQLAEVEQRLEEGS